MSQRERLTGKITMGSYSGGERGLRLELEDGESNMTVLVIELDTENAGLLLMNTRADCVYVRPHPVALARLGKTEEYRHEQVPGLKYDTWADREAVLALYAVEHDLVDWVHDELGERLNAHRLSEDGYRVTFRRWV